MPLTQKELNQTHCATPGCTCDDTQLILTSVCHPHTGTKAVYDKSKGVLNIECNRCGQFVVDLLIARINYRVVQ